MSRNERHSAVLAELETPGEPERENGENGENALQMQYRTN
jgi:hypothetical protein